MWQMSFPDVPYPIMEQAFNHFRMASKFPPTVAEMVEELKKVLTRCHDTCKVIVIGHTGQIDIRGGSGFHRYLEHFQGHEKCAVCKLTTNHRGWLSTYADQLEE